MDFVTIQKGPPEEIEAFLTKLSISWPKQKVVYHEKLLEILISYMFL